LLKKILLKKKNVVEIKKFRFDDFFFECAIDVETSTVAISIAQLANDNNISVIATTATHPNVTLLEDRMHFLWNSPTKRRLKFWQVQQCFHHLSRR
jgi:uncharacterized 2Fe-2S/4Fe-4S cluster protein (DUF4445 family)